MPRFYKEHARGYDLDLELPFLEANGVRYHLGSAGSMIWCCPVCGAEHFRIPISVDIDRPEHCFDGHGPMELLTLNDVDRWDGLYASLGIKTTSVETRRAARIADEGARPWYWQFGNKTEADFPLGYVKEGAQDKPSPPQP